MYPEYPAGSWATDPIYWVRALRSIVGGATMMHTGTIRWSKATSANRVFDPITMGAYASKAAVYRAIGFPDFVILSIDTYVYWLIEGISEKTPDTYRLVNILHSVQQRQLWPTRSYYYG